MALHNSDQSAKTENGSSYFRDLLLLTLKWTMTERSRRLRRLRLSLHPGRVNKGQFMTERERGKRERTRERNVIALLSAMYLHSYYTLLSVIPFQIRDLNFPRGIFRFYLVFIHASYRFGDSRINVRLHHSRPMSQIIRLIYRRKKNFVLPVVTKFMDGRKTSFVTKFLSFENQTKILLIYLFVYYLFVCLLFNFFFF